MKPFVEMFLDYTQDAESPTSYFKWAAYTALGVTMRNNVWIDRVFHKVYPNMYTLILSRRSSMTKKSTPLTTALKLLKQVDNTKIISGRGTVRGIIDELVSVKTMKDGSQDKSAVGVLYSEEITSFVIDQPDYFTDTITDWYDGHVEWGSFLGSGNTRVENICLSMLTSSNEELIRSVFNVRALGGGLLARTFLIMESKKRHKNSLMYPSERQVDDTMLVNHLMKVSKLKGPFTLTDEARKIYHEWYNEFEPLDENVTTTGIEGRIATHILKLAMVKSVSERFDLFINEKMMLSAIEECINLLPNYRLFATGNDGPIEKVGRKIIELLLDQKDFSLPKHKILWSVWGAGSAMVDQAIDSLTQAHILEVYTDTKNDSEFSLKLTKQFIQKLAQR